MKEKVMTQWHAMPPQDTAVAISKYNESMAINLWQSYKTNSAVGLAIHNADVPQNKLCYEDLSYKTNSAIGWAILNVELLSKTNAAIGWAILNVGVLYKTNCYWLGNTQCRSVVQNKLLLVGQYSMQICRTKQTAIGWAILNADLLYKTNSAIGLAILNADLLYKTNCYWLGNTQCRSVVQNKLLLVGQYSMQICYTKQTLLLVWQYSMQICRTKQTAIGWAILNADLSYKTNCYWLGNTQCRFVVQNKLCYWSSNTQCRSVVQNKLCYWSGNTQCRNVLQKQTLLSVGQNSIQICQIQNKLCYWSGNTWCRSHSEKE